MNYYKDMEKTLVTVVEHAHYLSQAAKLLTEDQKQEIVDMLAADPEMGDLIIGTGGCRKLRYAAVKGKGKSGGVRIIQLFVSKEGTVHLLDVYKKGEKDSLTKAEKNELSKLTAILKG
ncbi:MAG: addiction module toxin RelE [Pseudomonadota bacterium]